MADVKNIITMGIGASPGAIIWFFTGGLEVGSSWVQFPSTDVESWTGASDTDPETWVQVPATSQETWV